MVWKQSIQPTKFMQTINTINPTLIRLYFINSPHTHTKGNSQ